MFCTQITKMSDFRADMRRFKRTRDFVMVGPILGKISLQKMRKTRKKKVTKFQFKIFYALKNYREKCPGLCVRFGSVRFGSAMFGELPG